MLKNHIQSKTSKYRGHCRSPKFCPLFRDGQFSGRGIKNRNYQLCTYVFEYQLSVASVILFITQVFSTHLKYIKR